MAREGKAPVLMPHQIRTLFKAAQLTQHAKRNVAMLHASYSLALRACEIRRLRLYDVLEEDQQTLVDTINLLKTMTKKQKQRHVPFSNPKAREAFNEYIKERKEEAGGMLDLKSPLFRSQKGGYFKPNTIVMLIRKIHHMAGFKAAKSHSGRRTCLTLLYARCKDIKLLQLVAGHEYTGTTMGYIEDNPIKLHKLMEKPTF